MKTANTCILLSCLDDLWPLRCTRSSIVPPFLQLEIENKKDKLKTEIPFFMAPAIRKDTQSLGTCCRCHLQFLFNDANVT